MKNPISRCKIKQRKRLSMFLLLFFSNNEKSNKTKGVKMVSLKDIAQECKVSVATVSKALNDHSDIGEETKQRIRKKAKEMGYLPNFAAQALKTNRTYNIGVLFADQALSGLTHDFFSHILDSFKRSVEKRGYDITFINCYSENTRRKTYLEHVKYRGFDGVVIACVDFGNQEVVELVNSDVPVVTIDHLFNNRISIVSDNIKGVSELLHYVYNMGHRRIAFIHGIECAVTSNRLSSFYKTAKELGLKIPDEYIKEGDYRGIKESFEKTNELLDLKRRPTCIFYPDDFACLGGISAIKQRGLSIPEDISVVGYDGIPLSKHINPNLTTLAQDTEALGAKAAESLISLIEEPKTTIIGVSIVPGVLVEGQSVKNLNE